MSNLLVASKRLRVPDTLLETPFPAFSRLLLCSLWPPAGLVPPRLGHHDSLSKTVDCSPARYVDPPKLDTFIHKLDIVDSIIGRFIQNMHFISIFTKTFNCMASDEAKAAGYDYYAQSGTPRGCFGLYCDYSTFLLHATNKVLNQTLFVLDGVKNGRKGWDNEDKG